MFAALAQLEASDLDLVHWIEESIPKKVVIQYPLIPAPVYLRIMIKVMDDYPSMPQNLVKEYIDASLKVACSQMMIEKKEEEP